MSLTKADDPSHFQQEIVIVSSFQDNKFCPSGPSGSIWRLSRTFVARARTSFSCYGMDYSVNFNIKV
jgi:hypothetical protein